MLHRTKKEKDMNKDKYIGVGGHIEHGESPEDCIIREVREETGFTLNSVRLRGLITFVIDDIDEYTALFTSKDFLNPSAGRNELPECNEGDLVWVKKQDISKLSLWAGDLIFFRLLEEREDFFSLKLVYVKDELVEVAVDGVVLNQAYLESVIG